MGGETVLLCALALFGTGGAIMKAWGATCVLGPVALLAVVAVLEMWRMAGRRRVGPDPRSLAVWAFVFLAGAASMKLQLSRRPCDQSLGMLASSRRVVLVGVVVGIPEAASDGRLRAIVKLESANGDTAAAGVRVLIVAEGHDPGRSPLVSGGRVRAAGRFYLPRPPANPGEPDMRVVMGCRGISGTLYVRTPDDIDLLSIGQPGVPSGLAGALRDHVTAITRATLPENQAAILSGMLFGTAPPEMSDSLQATGTSHLFAVSGLHVGLVAAVVYGLLGGLRLSGPALLAPCLVAVWVYAMACGMRPSVVRAAIMLSCAGACSLVRRKGNARGFLYLAGLLMVIQNPLVMFDPGAQMSFAAVFSILHLSARLRQALRPLPAPVAEPFSASLAAHVGVTPLGAWYFGRVTPVAVIANIPCLALAGIAVTTGFAAGVVGVVHLPAAAALNSANSLVLLALERVIDLFARLPFGSFTVARPPVWAVLGTYGLLLATGAPRPVRRALGTMRRRLAILGPAAAAAVVWVAVLRPGVLEVVFLSVGQGDSAFIRSPSGRTILVDGGGTAGPGPDPGAEVVVPYLLRRGVNRLDVVVVTHPHQDHVGGLLEVIQRLRVEVVLKPPVPEEIRPDLDRRLVAVARERGVPVVEVVGGGQVSMGDGVTISVLHPPPPGAGPREHDLNDLSIVMMVTFQGLEVLFTGDAGPEVLEALTKRGISLDADVLKVPHHGARGACPPGVLEAISPDWAVIPVGPNTFGHPAGDTIESLARSGARVFRTDTHGAVTARGRDDRVRLFTVRGTVPDCGEKGRLLEGMGPRG